MHIEVNRKRSEKVRAEKICNLSDLQDNPSKTTRILKPNLFEAIVFRLILDRVNIEKVCLLDEKTFDRTHLLLVSSWNE